MKNLKLKTARTAMDMSQQQLADAVGVTRQTIGMIEAGKYNPTLNLCISICKVLGKTLDDIFWEDEENAKEKLYTQNDLNGIIKKLGVVFESKKEWQTW